MTLRETEFAALRNTIAIRGTARPAIFVAAVIGWGSLALTTALLADFPMTTLIPLLVLFAGFEAVHGLHVGVERIGRYLQATYEASSGDRMWESTAMALGPGLPGGGADPLFTAVFAACILANLVSIVLFESTLAEASLLVGTHAAFIVRIVRARLVAARQRAVELTRLVELRSPAIPPASVDTN